jgi:hypothetical protein
MMTGPCAGLRLNEVSAEVPTARKGGAWTTRPFTAGSTGIGDPANKSEKPLAYWSFEETAILAPTQRGRCCEAQIRFAVIDSYGCAGVVLIRF